MPEWSAVIGAKAALLLVMLAFAGWSLFPITAGRGLPTVGCWQRGAIMLAVLAVIATLVHYQLMIASMFGAPSSQVDLTAWQAMLLEPTIGMPVAARIGLLLASVAWVVVARTRIVSGSAVLAVAALSTLSFSGHAGGGTGIPGWLHLLADGLHLLVAAVWLAALVGFFAASFAKESASIAALHRSLDRFSTIGTFVVAALVATGTINLVSILGAATLNVFSTNYGLTLGIKLGLLTIMLACAGVNRWTIVPALRADGASASINRLRISLAIETLALIGLVIVVAILGSMDPLT